MAGRPRADIDWDEVDKYLQAQCDGASIAGMFGIAPETLYRACQREHNVNFDTYSQQKKSEGKQLLRAKQFEVAMTGDRLMLIWLGKQYLEQSDKKELSGKDGKDLYPAPKVLTKEQAKQFLNDLDTNC